MTGFPASIESSLLEADFTATEILVLRRLIDGNAATLRELAAKTGKSTGVLDQAVRKLIAKRILCREQINGAVRYVVGSLDAIGKWMERDLRSKQASLKRKQQNFDAFIANQKLDRSRPEMEYFEGVEGMKQAYTMLLDLAEDGELLFYYPVHCKEEDDPLCAFWDQYTRQRRRRGIMARIIAHDTPLGRRYQSRDPFTFRETRLIPKERAPFAFEKVVGSGLIACFGHEVECACFIRFPQLAKTEREAFEALWRSSAYEQDGIDTETGIPLKTKIWSFGERFLGMKTGTRKRG